MLLGDVLRKHRDGKLNNSLEGDNLSNQDKRELVDFLHFSFESELYSKIFKCERANKDDYQRDKVSYMVFRVGVDEYVEPLKDDDKEKDELEKKVELWLAKKIAKTCKGGRFQVFLD